MSSLARERLETAFRRIDTKCAGEISRGQLKELISTLEIAADADALFDALVSQDSQYLRLESLTTAFAAFLERGNDDGDDDNDSGGSSDDETGLDADDGDPVEPIISLMRWDNAGRGRLGALADALEEYIQRRLSEPEREALNVAFRRHLSNNEDDDNGDGVESSLEPADVRSLLLEWQNIIHDDDNGGGDDDYDGRADDGRVSPIHIVGIRTDSDPLDDGILVYESGRTSPSGRRRRMSSSVHSMSDMSASWRDVNSMDGLRAALKRSDHQRRQLRAHIAHQRKFIESQNSSHELWANKMKQQWSERAEKETKRLKQALKEQRARCDELEKLSDALRSEASRLSAKIREMESKRRRDNRDKTTEKETIAAERAEFRDAYAKLEKECRRSREQAKSATLRATTLEETAERGQRELEEARAKIEELHVAAKSHKEIEDSLRQSVLDLEDVVATLRGKVESPVLRRRQSGGDDDDATSGVRNSKRRVRAPSSFGRIHSAASIRREERASTAVANKEKKKKTMTTTATPTRVVHAVSKRADEEADPVLLAFLAEQQQGSNSGSSSSSSGGEGGGEKKKGNGGSGEDKPPPPPPPPPTTTTPTSLPTTTSPSSSSRTPTAPSTPTATDANSLQRLLEEATSLAHKFKGDYLDVSRRAALRPRIDSAGGDGRRETVLFSSVVVRLVPSSKLLSFLSTEARRWRRVLVLTDAALYEMDSVVSLKIRRRVPLESICTLALSRSAHDCLALMRRESYDRVYQTMRRTELVVRIMQACQMVREKAKSKKVFATAGRKRASLSSTLKAAQVQRKKGQISRVEYDAVVRSCARQEERAGPSPLKVRFLATMLLTFSGGEIKQMFFDEKSGQVHIIAHDARQSPSKAELAGFVCPLCRKEFSTAANLMAHYQAAHPQEGRRG
eukprot:g5183.t1